MRYAKTHSYHITMCVPFTYPISQVYVWTFVFVCVFILLNILLAILVAGYTDIAESSYGAGSILGDLYECLCYWACSSCLPVTRFVSDEQLADYLSEEVAALSERTDALGGAGSRTRDGGLDEKAQLSAAALDARESILLGQGRCLDERDTRVLVLSLLERNAFRRAASAAGISDKDRRRSSLGVCAPAEGGQGTLRLGPTTWWRTCFSGTAKT